MYSCDMIVVWNLRAASTHCLCWLVFVVAAAQTAASQDVIEFDVQTTGVGMAPPERGDDVQTVNRTSSFMAMPESMADSDLQCLQELPLGQLLKIRKSLSVVSHMMDPVPGYWANETGGEDERRLSRGYVEDGTYVGGDGYAFDFNHTDSAYAQPLVMDTIKDKVGYDEGWVEEKPSKVQKIFQLSVTALAFLAFGGYLLCMIVQAIKSKGTTYYHPAITTAASTASLSIRKRRPARMRRTPANNKENNLNYRSLAGPSPDDLYKVLVLAAEGFVNLGQLK